MFVYEYGREEEDIYVRVKAAHTAIQMRMLEFVAQTDCMYFSQIALEQNFVKSCAIF
jgi:hypothetical protein